MSLQEVKPYSGHDAALLSLFHKIAALYHCFITEDQRGLPGSDIHLFQNGTSTCSMQEMFLYNRAHDTVLLSLFYNTAALNRRVIVDDYQDRVSICSEMVPQHTPNARDYLITELTKQFC